MVSVREKNSVPGAKPDYYPRGQSTRRKARVPENDKNTTGRNPFSRVQNQETQPRLNTASWESNMVDLGEQDYSHHYIKPVLLSK